MLTLLRENPYHVYISGKGNTVQVGNNNSITEETQNEDTSDAIAGLEELIKKLTTAVEVNIKERSSTEMKLDKTEVIYKKKCFPGTTIHLYVYYLPNINFITCEKRACYYAKNRLYFFNGTSKDKRNDDYLKKSFINHNACIIDAG